MILDARSDTSELEWNSVAVTSSTPSTHNKFLRNGKSESVDVGWSSFTSQSPRAKAESLRNKSSTAATPEDLGSTVPSSLSPLKKDSMYGIFPVQKSPSKNWMGLGRQSPARGRAGSEAYSETSRREDDMYCAAADSEIDALSDEDCVRDSHIASEQFLFPTSCPIRLVSLAKYRWIAAAPPAIVLILASIALLWINKATSLWSCAVYVAMAVLGLGWQFVVGLLQDRELILQMAAQVSQIIICDEADTSSLLSKDERVYYVQTHIHGTSVRRTLAKEQAQRRRNDPMHFIRKDFAAWDKSRNGYTVIDTTGVILYVNDTMCRQFGHDGERLVGENVRFLMPAPYNQQHDHFLKRHLACGATNVIGTNRAVPILRADGTQSIVHLSVQECVDPGSSSNRLFVGVMKFAVTDGLMETFRNTIKHNETGLLEACQILEKKAAAVVVIEHDGTVVFISKAGERMFGWSREDIRGLNVKVLMGEPYASRHDGFLHRYRDSAELAERQEHSVVSNIVGSGRDVVAKHRNGTAMRVFLMVERVNRPTAADNFLFVGTMVPIKDPADADNPQARKGPPAHRVSAEDWPRFSGPSSKAQEKASAGSQSESSGSHDQILHKPRRASVVQPAASLGAILAREKEGGRNMLPRGSSLASSPSSTLQPLSLAGLRKCTVVVVDAWGLPSAASDEGLYDKYLAFCSHLKGGCRRHRGFLQWLVGDRAVVTFNAVVSNTSHRPSAGNFILQLHKDWQRTPAAQSVRLRIAAVMRQTHCAVWGKMNVMVGEAVDTCSAMLGVGHEMQVEGGIIDSSLYEEVQYSFQCRALNIMTLHAGTAAEKLYSLYELQEAKEVAVDEWMYQICHDSDTDDPLAAWKKCWASLGDERAATARVVGRYTTALKHMEQFIEDHPEDRVALWLQRAIKARRAAPTDFPTKSTTWGKLPVLIHYTVPEAAAEEGPGPQCDRSVSSPLSPSSKEPTLTKGCSFLGSHAAMRASASTRLEGDLKLFRVLSDNIRMLLAAGSDAVVVIDTEEIIHYWNGQAEALFGWSAEEAMGQKLNIILPVDLQNGKHSTYINRVLATGQLRTRGLVRGTHGVHRNGELVPVDLNVAVCAMTTSEATLFVGFFRSRKEEQKQDTLLMDTFPPDIVKKLLANPMAQIAERFESASILFVDIVGFTAMSSTMEPEEIVRLLTTVTCGFDAVGNEYQMTKIKTIGDGYMAVCGVPKAVRGHTEKSMDCGLAFLRKLEDINAQGMQPELSVRMGISTGPVVAGVIGETRKFYDVWGDAVNTASRMESNGEPGRVQISESTYDQIRNKGSYIFHPNQVRAKSKGLMKTYFVEHKLSRGSEQWNF